jgi:hypothetical protein
VVHAAIRVLPDRLTERQHRRDVSRARPPRPTHAPARRPRAVTWACLPPRCGPQAMVLARTGSTRCG